MAFRQSFLVLVSLGGQDLHWVLSLSYCKYETLLSIMASTANFSQYRALNIATVGFVIEPEVALKSWMSEINN